MGNIPVHETVFISVGQELAVFVETTLKKEDFDMATRNFIRETSSPRRARAREKSEGVREVIQENGITGIRGPER